MPSSSRRRAVPDLPPIAAGPPSPGANPRVILLLRVLWLLLLLFGFLVSIETMSKSIKALGDVGLLGGGGDEAELFAGVSNPFAGLALGILFTVIVQSSSVTTSTIVAMVASQTLSVEHAVPMVLGANIGTTITATLVSLGHVRHSGEFHRAFACATLHDFFNLIVVSILFPLEITTHFLARSAAWITSHVGRGGGSEYKSPIKNAIKEVHHWITDAVESTGLDGKALAVTTLVLGVLMIFGCLYLITKNMRHVIAGKIESGMNRVLDSSGMVPLGIGILITCAVQSSSITTSLMVPMCAAGVLTLEKAFPVMLGANIGTTITALLASMAQDAPEALTIAVVHLLFNIVGTLMVFPFPRIRAIPVALANMIARTAVRSKMLLVVYVVGMFIVVPLSGWFLWGG